MERKTALKNIFHCNHLLIKSFYCPVTAPALQPHGCTVLPAAALLPPRAGARCASDSIWARLFLIFLCLSSYSLTTTPSSGHGSLLDGGMLPSAELVLAHH